MLTFFSSLIIEHASLEKLPVFIKIIFEFWWPLNKNPTMLNFQKQTAERTQFFFRSQTLTKVTQMPSVKKEWELENVRQEQSFDTFCLANKTVFFSTLSCLSQHRVRIKSTMGYRRDALCFKSGADKGFLCICHKSRHCSGRKSDCTFSTEGYELEQ